MLFIPDRKILKALAKEKRRRRRRRIVHALLLLFLLCGGLGAASVSPAHNLLVDLHRATTVHQFDFVDWESQAIFSEINRRVTSPEIPTGLAEQRRLVDRFLELEEEIRQLEHDLNRHYALGDESDKPPELSHLEQQLAELEAAQRDIAPQVEVILTRQVETILREEGFVWGNRVFPPVAFRLIDPPTALIVSPRDRIENQHFVGLQPGLDNSIRTNIEDTLDQRGDVSSYVTNIGGLGSYPTMVVNTANLVFLIDVVAHEWTHNYLFTFPTNIAWGYQTYPRLTTINETTATLVGQEISRKVITRFYPDWVDRLPPADESGVPVPREPSEFDLAMRRIRLRVDHLLAEGKIEAAEEYMETERLELVEKGYNLRKLNQAYFAFHGSYAFGPDSVDPTGDQLRQLRAVSTSLRNFLQRVGWLNSYSGYQNWLHEANIATQLPQNSGKIP